MCLERPRMVAARVLPPSFPVGAISSSFSARVRLGSFHPMRTAAAMRAASRSNRPVTAASEQILSASGGFAATRSPSMIESKSLKSSQRGKQLVVLSCSATKVETQGSLPAISLYDGPLFRVLRSYLRDFRWPERLSIAVLSAKYGIIGGLFNIETYDQRMTR